MGTRFVWGVGTHLIGARDNTLRLTQLADLGFTAFRDDVHWANVEAQQSRYLVPAEWDAFVTSAASKGIRPLLILDYGNPLYGQGARPTNAASIAAFAQYAKFMVQHFKGARPIYEVWNEWRMDSPQDVREYVALLSNTHREIKHADPTAMVIAGGFGVRGVQALRWFVGAGGTKYVDAVSLHPYVHCESSSGPEGYVNLVKTMTDIVAKGPKRPLFLTEVGWPTHHGRCGISEEEAATYLAEAYLSARCLPHVAGMWWYGLRNDGRNPLEREHNFGLLSADFKPKAAAAVARKIGGLNGTLVCKRYIGTSRQEALYQLDGHTLSFDTMTARLLAAPTASSL
jgi:hypothetical protein